MGLDTRRPPLPAPTDTTSVDDTSPIATELATNVTARTDKTSYTIPEDGSPVVLSTHKKDARSASHGSHHQSQTSLLIEYFEGSRSGDKAKGRPSVRVKVTPSSRKTSSSARANDAVHITSIGKDRKPSYTRRISLGSKTVETGGPEGTEVSHSSESNLSARPPVEIEVLDHNASDLSNSLSSRGLLYAHNDSTVSSMPPDSMLEQNAGPSRVLDDDDDQEDHTITEENFLKAPHTRRSRSTSRDRITQKVIEKLGQTPTKTHKSSRSSRERGLAKEYGSRERGQTEEHDGRKRDLDKEYDRRDRRLDKDHESHERRHRSSKSHATAADDDAISGAESSLVSSNPAPSQLSNRSDVSASSRMTNNPRLLQAVEDTIKRMILPEITAIRDDQRADRGHRSSDASRRGSIQSAEYERGLERRVSKSSSSPNISSKPKILLNRDGDDPGTVLSRGDSEYRKVRKSSGDRPSGRHSSAHRRRDSYDDDTVRPRSSKGKDLGKLAAAGVAGGVLTAAALKHHDSQHNVNERRKKRTTSRGSRSRSNSIADTVEDAHPRKHAIPPMPMASRINDSELTRESILSVDRDSSDGADLDSRTPLREVSRGSFDAAMSPVSSRTPTRTPVSKGLGMSHMNRSIDSQATSGKDRTTALAATGLGAAAAAHLVSGHARSIDADGYGRTTPKRTPVSPAQSVSSLRKQYEEPLVPSADRPRSTTSRSSAGRLRGKESLNSAGSSPTTRLTRSRERSANPSLDEFRTPMERPQGDFLGDRTLTPNGEEVEEWFKRQHLQNEQYRSSLDVATNRQSYQTNPYPEDEKRFSSFTQRSGEEDGPIHGGAEHDVRGLGANPEYVHTPVAVESAVASLMEPSTLSSGNAASSLDSPARASYSDRMAEHLRSLGKDDAVVYDGSTISERMPSHERWATLKGHAQTLSGSTSRDNVDVGSPRQSPAKSLRHEDEDEVDRRRDLERGRELDPDDREDESPVKLGASGLPVAEDPMPEIGHYDDTKSEVSTNPSVIKGPLGGDVTGNDAWPYTPSPRLEEARDRKSRSGYGRDAMLGVALAGGATALAAADRQSTGRQPTVEDEGVYRRQPSFENDVDYVRQPSVEDEGEYGRDGKLTPDVGRYEAARDIDRNATPTLKSPNVIRDEGYATDAGARTPKAEQRYGQRDIDAYNQAMGERDVGEDDPFTSKPKHARQVSGNSHGMASPLYDSANGTGIDRIQSKDIVALMDHLTVRDAQRNARDTEILITLVRTATEMRQNFEDMKRFISEQDRLIMANAERGTEQTLQKVLAGPRPQPPGSPRTPRKQSDDDIQSKRKGVLRRALKGLTGGRNASDLAKIEDMLVQVLGDVEQLKHQGVAPRQAPSSYLDDSMDSYEKLRAAPEPGYEPEGAGAGTNNSTPTQSGYFGAPAKTEKQMFHSGYNGRPGSENRVSTVVEGDEDEALEPHERKVLENQFENNERMLTPTQDIRARTGLPQTGTPPQHAATYHGMPANNDLTPRAAERQRAHKANTSSVLQGGPPKTSRWSKTTTSSAAPDANALDSPGKARNTRPVSAASRSGSDSQKYDDDGYSVHDDDRLRSTQSLAREQDRMETRSVRSQASRITREPSPLIPSEASYDRDDDDEADRRHGPHSRDVSPVQHDDYEPEGDLDDPKYRSTRNSLLLQHPQPRAGPTNRHQDTLENKAQSYGDVSATTGSDLSQRSGASADFDPALWGSAGVAALAKHRFSQAEPLSPVSMGSPHAGRAKDDGPLVPSSSKDQRSQRSQQQQQRQQPQPQQQHQRTNYEQYDEDDGEDEQDWEPQYSNSGFAKAAHPWYTSPLGSGHLLEPIEEVRYSLETDSGHVSARNPISQTSLSPIS